MELMLGYMSILEIVVIDDYFEHLRLFSSVLYIELEEVWFSWSDIDCFLIFDFCAHGDLGDDFLFLHLPQQLYLLQLFKLLPVWRASIFE